MWHVGKNMEIRKMHAGGQSVLLAGDATPPVGKGR